MKYHIYNKYSKIQPKNKERMQDLSSISDHVLYQNHVYLYGGDGTINSFINKYTVKKLTILKYGSGNDFYKNLKKKQQTTYIYNANEHKFINGFGCGIDAHVCKTANNTKSKAYYKIVLESLKSYQTKNIDIEIDGKTYHFKNIVLLAIQNGKYFGGGLKIAPKANVQDEKLDVIIGHSLKNWQIYLILPLVKLGLHPLFKSKVFYKKASNIKILSTDLLFQIDGEVHQSNKNIEISAYKSIVVNKKITR